jgi:CelD/BcsL family acetyltransferase involved in cellulose biosynthesis
MIEYDTTKEIKFEVVTDLDAARAVWDALAAHSEIDDEWDFRYIFYRHLGFPLHFIVAYDGERPVGLLPLQLNTGEGPIPQSYELKHNFLEFFGGDDTDSNRVLTAPGYEHLVPQLFEQIDRPAVLAPLAEPYADAHQYTNKYIADLRGLGSFPDFLNRYLDGKSRGKMLQQVNRLERNNEVAVSDGTAADLPQLFEYNLARFGEASSFNYPYRRQVFADLMERYDHDVFTIKINGETKAVGFALIYNNAYLAMNIGYDYDVRDLGKYIIGVEINRAIERGCDVFDSGKGGGGWKEQFRLEQLPQYMLTLRG